MPSEFSALYMATNHPLQALRVLVTRPEAQAEAWQQSLVDAGACCAAVPLLAIVPLTVAEEQQAIKNRVMELDSYQHVIFVSQNAVRYGMEWIYNYWPQLPMGVSFYAVGSATARTLQQFDVPVVAAEGTMNSEALVALPSLQQIDGAKVLICRGQGGRPLLADILAERGARVDYCELYERRFPQAALEQIATLDWGRQGDVVAVHSGESLDNWQQLVTALKRYDWQGLPLLVPGQRVANKAIELGFNRVIVADNASDTEMLRALCAWQRAN